LIAAPARLPSPYLLQCSVQVWTDLGVHDDRVAARLRVVDEIPLRLDNHEVHFYRQPSGASHGLDHRRAECEVGDKPAIHHVTMDHVGAGGFGFGNLLAEPGEISREDGRRDLQLGWHRRQLYPVEGQISRVIWCGNGGSPGTTVGHQSS
jgi:hypothetical protein